MTNKIIEQAMEMVILFNPQGQITYGNQKAQELLEYRDGVESCHIHEIFPGAFRLEEGQIVMNTPSDEDVAIMAYRQNRTCFAVEMRVIPYEDNLYMCLALDASKKNYYERKANQSDQEAEAAQQVKTQFVANVTHELRTPVNGILGNVQELLSKEMDEEKCRLLHLVERGCNDMHSIINNILDFSKLDAGKFELESRTFDFRGMMDYVKATHINKITEKGLQFFMTISPEIPEQVIGDDLRIQQILNNLISNATKFTHTGKIVVEVVKTAQMDGRIELFFMVIDSGIGIAKEDQDKLFHSFSQVEASTTRKYGGTGLGLNISKQLVELMNGSIHVESERNKGTMFSFHIWLDLPADAAGDNMVNMSRERVNHSPFLSDMQDNSALLQYGSQENIEEIQKKMSKLILCIEMTNWEKAEDFMDSIKQLTEEAPREIKSSVLRLKMAVQKEDYDKSIAAYERVQEMMKGE